MAQKQVGKTTNGTEARIERHCRRLGITRKALEASGGLSVPHFPRVPQLPPLQSVVFSGSVREDYTKPHSPAPRFVISDGKTIGVFPTDTDAILCLHEGPAGPFRQAVRVSPLGNTLLASR